MNVKIITDSISDISTETAEQYGVDVLPINVVLGDKKLKDDEDFSMKDMVSWSLYHHQFPKFRGINSEEYQKVFEKYAQDGRDIIVITADDKIISNYDSALHASTAFNNVNVQVINSKANSASMSTLVIKAAEMAMAGESANAIAIQMERMIMRPEMHIMFDNISMLKLTEYCPAVLKVGESLLNRKYHFIVVTGQSYDVNLLPSNGSKAIEKYCKAVFKDYEKFNKERLYIMPTYGSDEYFTYVHNYALSLEYFDDIVVLPCRAYSTAIGGEKSVGVGFTKSIS